MKHHPVFSASIVSVWVFLIGCCCTAAAQVCDNQCLAFRGTTTSSPNPDMIVLNPSPVSGNNDFTVEGWFLSTGAPLPGQQFRRLFTLAGTTRFEIGENGANVVLFWRDAAANSSFNVLAPISTSVCYHLAVARSGGTVQVFLDGAPVATLPGLGVLNTTLFHVGHWGGGQTPEQDWQGRVDEIRLWNRALTATEIQSNKDCTLGSNISGLLVNWHLNQNMTPDGPNPAGSKALDFSGNGNDGMLLNFDLANVNPLSNFVCNDKCPPALTLGITDLGSQSVSVVNICDGTGVHFCVKQNGGQVTGLAGATVTWEYFDVGISAAWTQITGNPVFAGFCFGVPPGNPALSANCAISTTGYVDRKFRAVVTKGSAPQTCTYISSERLLRIHCPVTNAAINFNPPLPSSPNVALCEGITYSSTVTLTSTHPYVNPPAIPPAGDLGIQWYIYGFPILSLNNLVTFPLSGVVFFPDVCIEAEIGNGVCPLYTAKICIPVDREPMCGTIDAKPDPALTHDPAGGQYDYLICPGNDAELMMVNPADFKNCNAMWQFMFPSQGVWIDLNGFGNSTQNTNTLPQLPPNPPGPSIWPAGETMILYRIECRPLHWPYSDCAPCHSNVVKISLKPQKPAPVISAAQNPICKNGSTVISVNPYDPNCTYDWYCNGVWVGNGPSINATEPACYWVEVFDGCYKQISPPLILQVCEIVPVIECPQDNPCACLGVPITLSGCSSYNTCGNTGPAPLTYSWSASNGGPCTPGPNGPCECVHTPAAGGTTYTLTVTDPNTGCSASKSITITPCQ